MKTLDKSVETAGLESMVTFLVASGADEFEHATPLYFCHGVFIDRFFLDRISQEWDSRGSAMSNHKKLIDDTASLDRNCLSFTKENV